MTPGYVYVLTNKAMPNYVKVGCSIYGGTSRARQLSSSSIPFPFHLAFEMAFYHCRSLEKSAHKILSPYRVARDREFFSCTPQMATIAIKTCAQKLITSNPGRAPLIWVKKEFETEHDRDIRIRGIIDALNALPQAHKRALLAV